MAKRDASKQSDPSRTQRILGGRRVPRHDVKGYKMAATRLTTIKLDEVAERRLIKLKRAYAGASNSDVVRFAIQLLDKAVYGRTGTSDLAFVERKLRAPGIDRLVLPFEAPVDDAE